MPTILFVDDDVNILNGLQRMLRPMRSEWTLAFTDNGHDALAILDREPVDVVVTDMRMPQMNGAELLSEVLRLHPQTVRIILSGQAELKSALAAIGLAHRYLSKPTEPQTLTAVLKRALDIIELVPNLALRGKLNGLQSLPSAPYAYSRLMELAHTPGCDGDALAEVVAFDMGMALKIMQIAGSAFVNSPCRTANVWRAIQILGPDLIRSLALNTEVFSDLAAIQTSIDRTAIAELLGVASGRALRILTDGAGTPDDAARAATHALLSDIGQVALALGAQCASIRACGNDDGKSLEGAERNCSGVCHVAAGRYLMELWGLPESLSNSIACGCEPDSGGLSQGGIDQTPIACLELVENLR